MDELADHIVVAIQKTSNGTVGCAYYVAREERLCCFEDIVDGGQDCLETLTLALQPTVLIVTPKTNHGSCDKLRGLGAKSSDIAEHDRPPSPYILVVRPAAEFRHENALVKLTAFHRSRAVTGRLMVPGDDANLAEVHNADEVGLTDEVGQLLQLGGRFDLNNRASIGCAGAIMAFLQRKKTSDFLPDDPDIELVYRVSHLEMCAMPESMLVSAETLCCLQVLQPESHPNAAKQGPGTSGAKESLSVFGLFQPLARSPQGKSNLRRMFLLPNLDRDRINTRLDFVSVFSMPKNQWASARLSQSLSKIKNMRSTVVSLRKGIEGGHRLGKFKSNVWSAILEFCYHTIDIADTLKDVQGCQDLALCNRLETALDRTKLQRLGKRIHDIVDLDESAEQRRTVINRHVNEDLDRVKDIYDTMEEILSGVAREINRALPLEIATPLNVLFIPQLGFFVIVPLHAGKPVYDGENDWELSFSTEQHLYFKNDRMSELDHQLGDLYAVICDTEIEIAHELAQHVLEDGELLIAASDLCGELDSLLAMVHGAIEHKLTRPKLVAENIIDIRGGRHILQEMTVPSFVPNDTLINDARMIVLTGPNYSGKSVYMKQVALIAYMTQIGCFVPAEAVSIGITDKILTRLATRETVSQAQSAFTTDLQQIVWALNACTPRSLLVLDEFGKGTDSSDGAGLASAIFQYLLSLEETPKILASTHFHEIFEDGRFDRYEKVAFAHMEVRVQNKGPDGVTYLYGLSKGRSTFSYGIQCATLNGVPSAIMERAEKLRQLAVSGGDLVTACAALSLEDVVELRGADELARAFTAQNLSTLGALDDIKDFLVHAR